MTGEVWTYVAMKPNDGNTKVRPILIIGNDGTNQLQYVDIHYVIVSSSADCGIYDVEISEDVAKNIGLSKKSVIKTTKIYTGSKSKLGAKICDLPIDLKKEFSTKYKNYQDSLISKFNEF